MGWSTIPMIAVISTMALSCVSTQRATPPAREIYPQLRINQEIDIELKGGEKLKRLKLRSIYPDRFSGEVAKVQREIQLADVVAMGPSFSDDPRRLRLRITPIKEGSKLTVVLKSGKTIKMVLNRADESTLVGHHGKRQIEISRADIHLILVQRPDPVATVFLFITPIVALAILAASFNPIPSGLGL